MLEIIEETPALGGVLAPSNEMGTSVGEAGEGSQLAPVKNLSRIVNFSPGVEGCEQYCPLAVETKVHDIVIELEK